MIGFANVAFMLRREERLRFGIADRNGMPLIQFRKAIAAW